MEHILLLINRSFFLIYFWCVSRVRGAFALGCNSWKTYTESHQYLTSIPCSFSILTVSANTGYVWALCIDTDTQYLSDRGVDVIIGLC